jgi:hypothetical protein
LRRFLIENDFRAQVLTTVRDPQVVYFWRKEFPLLSGRPQASILTRLDTFLRPKLVRNVVCQKENSLDVGRVMNEGKILLVKLAQGDRRGERASPGHVPGFEDPADGHGEAADRRIEAAAFLPLCRRVP